MKKLFILPLFIMATITGSAQQWESDLQAGLKEAARQNKKVLLFFSVPDQCDACVRLEKSVFKSQEFIEFAEQNFVLVKIDFSAQDAELSKEQLEKNLLIVEKYNKDGFFPHVVVLNKDARIARKLGVYNRETPRQYLSLLASSTKS